MATQGGGGPKMAPGRPNLMIFGAIACFRRSGSRFSGQNRPRSLEMMIYIRIMKISKSYFGPGNPKNDFYNFSVIFLRKNGPGGCRDPGNRYLGSRQPLHVVTDFPFYGFI